MDIFKDPFPLPIPNGKHSRTKGNGTNQNGQNSNPFSKLTQFEIQNQQISIETTIP